MCTVQRWHCNCPTASDCWAAARSVWVIVTENIPGHHRHTSATDAVLEEQKFGAHLALPGGACLGIALGVVPACLGAQQLEEGTKGLPLEA